MTRTPFAGTVGHVAVLVALLLTWPSTAGAGQLPQAPSGGACQAFSLASGGILSARFWQTNTDTITVPGGESAVVVGSLTTVGGAPLAGATLCVEESLIGAGVTAADRVVVPGAGLARTDATGTFYYRLPAGPSREATLIGGQTAYALRYFAKAMPTLSAAPRRVRNRGRAVRFWGRLPGPQARGHVVVLQVGAGPTVTATGPTRWITFRQVTTDRNGRFRTSYRFRRTFVPTIYRFRALVPRQAGYPWLKGSSRSIPVRVN